MRLVGALLNVVLQSFEVRLFVQIGIRDQFGPIILGDLEGARGTELELVFNGPLAVFPFHLLLGQDV